jgi:hypothetical protein
MPAWCVCVCVCVQLLGGKEWVLSAYGEILFRAWRDAVGTALQWDIEADCIQVRG